MAKPTAMAKSKANPTCPQCGNILTDVDRCGFCDWVSGGRPARRRGRCAYTLVQRQCPLPGVFTALSRSPEHWYCWVHDRPENRLPPGPDAEEAMAFLEDTRDELMMQHYGKRPYQEPPRPAASSPLIRQPGEGKEAYYGRMMAMLGKGMRSPAMPPVEERA